MNDPLYRRLLGDAYGRLPMPIQDMHDVREEATAEGRSCIERGRGPLVGLIGWLFGFPPAGDNVPVTVTFTVEHGCEIWRRSFAGKLFRSTQELGRGRRQGLLIERFGPLAFSMAATVKDRQLHLELQDARFLIVPLPAMLHPKIVAYEHVADGRFNFHVDLGLPLVGRLVRYRGWLEPVGAAGGVGHPGHS